MQLILDHISAILIGSAILLGIAAVGRSGQAASVEAGTFYSMKQHQLTFVDFLQNDLHAVVSVSSVAVDPTTGTFRLRTRPDPASTAVREVAYVLTTVKTTEEAVYQRITRYVDGVEAGSSPPYVTEWDIRLLNGEGKPVSGAADGRQIAVSLELTYPAAGPSHTVPETRWQMTFHPPLLQQKTTI